MISFSDSVYQELEGLWLLPPRVRYGQVGMDNQLILKMRREKESVGDSKLDLFSLK